VRLRYLLGAAAAAAGAVAATAQLSTMRGWLDDQFPVRSVAVAGELRHEDPRALGRWLAGRIEGGFFTADLEALRQAVADRPWVREASIRRSWPGTLRVTLAEHRASARWRPAPEGAWRLVSREGAVFRPARAAAAGEGLPALMGPRGRLDDLRRRRAALAARLGDDHRAGLLAVDARGDWRARVDDRVTVRFGRDHWQRRLDRLMRVARGWRLLDRRVARIDLRYPDGLAVALAEGQGNGDDEPNTGGAPARRPG
jgi:cell division protein FtsQ